MSYKTLMTGHAVIAVLSGTACVLIPTQLLTGYDVTLSPMGLVIYQFWGASLVGLGLLTWVGRRAEDVTVQKGIALALAFMHALNCVTAVRGQMAGANVQGWSMVGLFAALAIAFAYLRFVMIRGTGETT